MGLRSREAQSTPFQEMKPNYGKEYPRTRVKDEMRDHQKYPQDPEPQESTKQGPPPSIQEWMEHLNHPR